MNGTFLGHPATRRAASKLRDCCTSSLVRYASSARKMSQVFSAFQTVTLACTPEPPLRARTTGRSGRAQQCPGGVVRAIRVSEKELARESPSA